MAQSKPESPAEQFDSIFKSTKKNLLALSLYYIHTVKENVSLICILETRGEWWVKKK
jgi:hypothetical protein